MNIRSSRRSTSARTMLRRLGRALLNLLQSYPPLLLALSSIHLLAPQRAGLLALTQIFAPYLFWPLLLLTPLALRRRAVVLRRTITACLLVAALRFGSGLISVPPQPQPGATHLTALSWNLYVGNNDLIAIRDTLRATPAAIVALQELGDGHSALIERDAVLRERYRWRVLAPGGADGMGLLSALPMLEQGRIDNPHAPGAFPLLWARVDLGQGETLTVVTAHPRPGRLRLLGERLIPRDFDPSVRDAEIAFVRAFVDARLASGERVLLLGDFNITAREPAYATLSAGLIDAHLAVGLGPGSSWRPAFLMRRWQQGLIRIDYQLSSPALKPLRSATDCTPRGSDHCLLQVIYELRQARLGPRFSTAVPRSQAAPMRSATTGRGPLIERRSCSVCGMVR